MNFNFPMPTTIPRHYNKIVWRGKIDNKDFTLSINFRKPLLLSELPEVVFSVNSDEFKTIDVKRITNK